MNGGSGKQIDKQEACQIFQGGPSAEQPQFSPRLYLGKVDLQWACSCSSVHSDQGSASWEEERVGEKEDKEEHEVEKEEMRDKEEERENKECDCIYLPDIISYGH